MTEEELKKYHKKPSPDKSEKTKSDETKSLVNNFDEKKSETIKSDQTKSEDIKSDEKILAEPDQNFQTLDDEFETLCDATQNIAIKDENTVRRMVQNLQELSSVSDEIEKKILCKLKKNLKK